MKSKPSVSDKVEQHLASLGMFTQYDILSVHGGRHITLNDTIEKWRVHVKNSTGEKLEITSRFTLSECKNGIRLIPNTDDSDLYGDLLAEPIGRKLK